MARAVSKNARIGYTVGAWVVALVIFFPILYTIITSLKTEQEAIAGFNLIPLSVIPEIRITDKGLVLVPEMVQVPLFEPA